jgi:anti-sigma factor RsiW
MDCALASTLLLDRRRGKLDPERLVQLEAHLETCERCRRDDAHDEALGAALARIPRRRAPQALERSLEARWALRRVPAAGRMARTLGAACLGAALAAAVFLVWRGRPSPEPLYAEAVSDHLRLLYAERPLEVESGGVHQVKPWFAGRVDFAPVVAFGGDDDFPLQGGAVAYFLDRKAAAFEYKRRLHPITLFVFRADGIAWPTPSRAVGRARGTLETRRGFHVLAWQEDDLGYALVSDVDERDLMTLGAKIAGDPRNAP